MAKKPISIEALKHDAKRINIPTAEFESLMREEDKSPVQVAYERRNRDLDPQLIWRGKDEQDWSDLIVQAPPLYVQEKLHPKALIDDLKRQTKARKAEVDDAIPDLFADFNGLPDKEAVTEFYQHDLHWSNRMILGDSLSVMASLAEREGMRGKVQCVYFDPPYGIKFNSNFQWSTTTKDVKDGSKDHVTREPEQVKAFRDTWRDGIHSYLTYMRDRLTVSRDLLSDTGSIFVQIGDDNVHRLQSLMDEVFGDENRIALIGFAKTSGSTDEFLGQTTDYLLWYAKDKSRVKYRQLLQEKKAGESGGTNYNRIRTSSGESAGISALGGLQNSNQEWKIYSLDNLTSQSAGRDKGEGAASWFPVELNGQVYRPSLSVRWKTNEAGMKRLKMAGRLEGTEKRLGYVRYLDDFPAYQITNRWDNVAASFMASKVYVVQTSPTVVQRCLLMATDPGDLVLDPTCGSGTTAFVAEQWGRRWITIDTSRVSLALARSRIMGARFPYYLLADSPEGQKKEAQLSQSTPKTTPTARNIRLGFVNARVPHVTLKSITNNAEIDTICANLRDDITSAMRALEPFVVEGLFDADGEPREWAIPRQFPSEWPQSVYANFEQFWTLVAERQTRIERSIAAKADFEYLFEKPFTDTSRVRVAGPFTLESLAPHRTLAVGPNDELIDAVSEAEQSIGEGLSGADDFASMVLKNLRVAGVQQAHKEDRLNFTSLIGWPGELICAEGRYLEGDIEKRAGVFIGPEFGTVSRPDLVAAAREAGDAGFDVLVACAFNYDAHSAEFSKLGRVPVLRARMNPDLHMAGDLAATGAGNLFVIFGEPDIQIEDAGKDADGADLIRVKVSGVDVFKPQTGEVVSENADGIALWMLDTDYNEESFFVRHAYFLGANDPYKALKTTLKAEIDEEAWSSLNSDTSRPFPKPTSGRIAVKVINHLGDEVMKVFEAR
ncbi:MAG: site-specific DNA-methyltransferase [Parvibaculum sp.]